MKDNNLVWVGIFCISIILSVQVIAEQPTELQNDLICIDPPFDIDLVIDVSGSMDWSWEGDEDCSSGDDDDSNNCRIDIAKNAAIKFIDGLPNSPNDGVFGSYDNYVGITKFETDPVSIQGLVGVTSKNRLIDKIESLEAEGGTFYYPAIVRSVDKLVQTGRENVPKVIVFLSDGEANDGMCNTGEVVYYTTSDSGSGKIKEEYVQEPCELVAARYAESMGVSLFTIGIGEANEYILYQMANLANGSFASAKNVNELDKIYSRLSEEFCYTPFEPDNYCEIRKQCYNDEYDILHLENVEGGLVEFNHMLNYENKICCKGINSISLEDVDEYDTTTSIFNIFDWLYDSTTEISEELETYFDSIIEQGIHLLNLESLTESKTELLVGDDYIYPFVLNSEGCRYTSDSCYSTEICVLSLQDTGITNLNVAKCGNLPLQMCCLPAKCIPTTNSETGELCSDGIDNDCDGYIDAYDDECEVEPIQPTSCNGDELNPLYPGDVCYVGSNQGVYNEDCACIETEVEDDEPTSNYCGDGVKSNIEECDGNDFGGHTSCTTVTNSDDPTQPYLSGELRCDKTCKIVGCSTKECEQDTSGQCSSNCKYTNSVNCFVDDQCTNMCGNHVNLEIESENIVTQKKLVLFNGRPVIVNIVVWK